ncbi:MAG TPA: OmpA family protein, partial [Gemmatimonadales bacterium]|nr:OmpA family protein [Gemmatimonadales bacterium]
VGAGYDSAEDLAELRELLVGAERRRLRELERRLDAAGLTPEQIAELLPEAIVLRSARDRQLARALSPTVESAISESVRRNPREIASAIFPVLGPAIRKAIAETLAGLVASINRALEHSVSPRGLRWRFEAWRTGVPYAQIVLKHALIYRVEQVFLIHADSGLLLAHAKLPELEGSDADLISGMLTAIRDFVADSFGHPERDAGGLRRFSVGELTVMVEQGPRAVIAAVVRGQAPDTLLARLQDTLEAIHLQFSTALTDFEGDTAPFAATTPLLEECLATVVSTDRKADGRRLAAWLPWAVAAALIAAGLVWLVVRSERRWNRAVAGLESAPGIVLTRAERDGGRWRFSGLRDPLGANPSALLAAAGADTARVEQRWEPYLSLEPALVLARARKALGAPASVSLDLAGDTLRLRGTAPLAWVAAAARAPLPPGVARVDLSGVEPEVPAELAQLEREVEGQRVLFDVGSSVLGAAARAGATGVAASFRRLEAGAAADGAHATLELVGRTDLSGSDAANQALSRVRAEAVLAALAAGGVPAAAMRATGAGTGAPLAADDPAERARINRSVSFTVRLGWGAASSGESR